MADDFSFRSALLSWHSLMGADAVIGDSPCQLLSTNTPEKAVSSLPTLASLTTSTIPEREAPKPFIRSLGAPIVSLAEALSLAREMADGCDNFAAWEKAVRDFNGCPLKQTATHTVVGDGNPDSKLLLIGEAPGNDEDKQGIPFCGVSGQLLSKMLAAIGLHDRSHYYISNSIYWRPPGNRNPTPEEVSLCKPFLEKLIMLMQPEMIVLVGGVAAQNVLGLSSGITKLRGKIHPYALHEKEYRCFAIYHPSYLLRQPSKKREAWEDLQTLQKILKNQ